VIEELGQVDIHDELIACDDIGLRLRHRLVRGAARPEAVAVLAECPGPTAAEVAAPASVPTEPTPAVATVTVTIDPETGLLAKPECPLKSRMTYPSGNQPSGYCNLSHAPPPKESRVKSIAKTVKRTLD